MIPRLLRSFAITSLLCSTVAVAQKVYFPKGTLDSDPGSDKFVSQWYSGQLAALKEPSLFQAARTPVEEYRFLWLRTFHHPVAIRFVVKPNGTATMTEKIASGAGGYKPGSITRNVSVPLSAEQVSRYLAASERVKFWSLPSKMKSERGCDGSEWIIEAVKGGKYHVVSQWTPSSGPVFELGMLMLKDFSHLDETEEPIY